MTHYYNNNNNFTTIFWHLTVLQNILISAMKINYNKSSCFLFLTSEIRLFFFTHNSTC